MIAYPSVVFVLLQVIEFFINNYDLDHRFLTAGIVAAIVLLPAAVLWNWRHGEQGEQRVTRSEISAYAALGIAAVAAVAWYWSTAPVEVRPPSRSVEAVRSVAVMPFANAGDDADVQYLCDGIAESLTNWLASVPGVKVISKSAAFRLRDHSDDTAKLVEALGVDNVIRGRLEKHGDEIVISAALIDTSDESQLWGERMVQPLAKVLILERSIVAAIKDGLRLKVSDAASVQSAAGGTDDPDAYQHYLRGHFLIQATDFGSIDSGLEDLRTAISIDPQFALPYADIAAAMVQKVLYGMANDESLRGEARTAAFSAAALAPGIAEAHTALAMMHQTITFDWAAAEEAFEAAVALSPQNPATFARYSEFLWATLRFERALEIARRGLAIDPLDGSLMHSAGISLLYSGDFAGAAAEFGQWNQLYSGSHWSYVKYALALALDKQCDEAAVPAATAERLTVGYESPFIDTWLAWGYHVCGRNDLFTNAMARIAEYADANPDSIDVALIFYRVLEGDVDGAVDLVRKVADARIPSAAFMQIFLLDHMGWPSARALRQDPRMQDAVREMHFPPTEWSVN